METRFLECRADGRNVTGAALVYGDVARIPAGRETFAPGAFGDVPALDVRLNVMRDLRRLIARTGGGGLLLTDSPERLAISAHLPATKEADDALEMLRLGLLRGLSVEFNPVRESQRADLRTIEQASLSAVGLVDVPAYPSSVPQVRQDREGLSGAFQYDRDAVIADSGRRRKQRVRPGAFAFALQRPDREINLILGSPERPLASKQAGTLQLEDGPDALRFRVDRLPQVSYALDFLGLLRAGSVVAGLVPFFLVPPPDVVPDAEEEEEAGSGIFRHIINAGLLTALAIMFRAPRGNPGEVSTRAGALADDLPQGQDKPARRRRQWL